MFTKTDIDLGTLRVGQEVSVDFPYTDISLIQRMTASCGCSVPYNIASESLVRVKFTPNKIPAHIIQQGKKSYTSKKNVTVTYNNALDGLPITEVLSFTAVITN